MCAFDRPLAIPLFSGKLVCSLITDNYGVSPAPLRARFHVTAAQSRERVDTAGSKISAESR